MKTNRNSQCPCNSGKKYKHCCGSVSTSVKASIQPGQTNLEPGSYKTPSGFFPSIMCYCASSEDYCLVNGTVTFDEESKAVEMAVENLRQAFQMKESTGNKVDIATSLKISGYNNLENFKVVNNA
jgi:hypothetical protein